ncbi:MAG: serine hydrolase [Cypionkella sp.]|uniref:serine hydrolase n=1 Tax=Cypionkella sp. TaxID=2811411 RepID=UPI002AB9B220|nr:serine hydrolase [Cypionkella sp.]MDZ4310305.1 serine hydrolase [Cypionkella sp.]MDZ4393952.1 serine hydrolase [Cypionkella sp.]
MFFTETPDWSALGPSITAALVGLHGTQGLDPESFGLVLITQGADGPEGFAHRGDIPVYPCSLVKTFHLIHALALLEDARIAPHGEMDRALRDMIRVSSNTATNYAIDLITGTTGDTLLHGAEYLDWVNKRERLNRFFWALGWDEWQGCSIAQKLMDDTRYGREAQFAGADGAHLNRLTPLAAARVLWELFEGDLPLSPPSKARAQAILQRDKASPDAANPAYQLSEYLAGDLPEAVQIWSKAGHNLWTGDAKTSWFKHDMVRLAAPNRKPLTVVLTTQGQGMAQTYPQAFPEIGRLIWEMTEGITRA